MAGIRSLRAFSFHRLLTPSFTCRRTPDAYLVRSETISRPIPELGFPLPWRAGQASSYHGGCGGVKELRELSASFSCQRDFQVEKCVSIYDIQGIYHPSQALVRTPFLFTIGDRGFAKAVSLPPQMQKPMRLRVYMGSPGIIAEPYKPRPPPLPLIRRWFTKEGWQIRKENLLAMLKTSFVIAKLRQKSKGYTQSKFYREASDLYRQINYALAQGDRSVLRQLVTDTVLTGMKKELKHRETSWAQVHWELVGPIKKIRTLQGRLVGVDQTKNLDNSFAQLTLRIISNQKFAAYDKHGKLVAGDLEKELTVEDIWVFEKHLTQPEAKWRLCGRLSV
jgi:hypothetical protein